MTTTAALQLELLDVDGRVLCALDPGESRREVLRVAPADAARCHSIRLRDADGAILIEGPLQADPACEMTDELVARLRLH